VNIGRFFLCDQRVASNLKTETNVLCSCFTIFHMVCSLCLNIRPICHYVCLSTSITTRHSGSSCSPVHSHPGGSASSFCVDGSLVRACKTRPPHPAEMYTCDENRQPSMLMLSRDFKSSDCSETFTHLKNE